MHHPSSTSSNLTLPATTNSSSNSKRGSFMTQHQEKGRDIGERAYEMAKGAVCSGMLLKQSRKIGIKWRARFVVLMPDKMLYYFNSPTDSHTLSQVDLSKVEFISPIAKPKKFGIELREHGRAYYFAAEDEKDQMHWITNIEHVRSGQHMMTSAASMADTSSHISSTHHSSPQRSRNNSAATPMIVRSNATTSGIVHPWKAWSVDTMRAGSIAHKYSFMSDHKPKKRYLQLSADKSCIRWGTYKRPDDNQILNRVLPLDCIEGVVYGPLSATLSQYHSRDKLRRGSWKCISFKVRVPNGNGSRRTIDLQFREENDAIGWIIGLKILAIENVMERGEKTDSIDVNAILENTMSEYKGTKLRLQMEEASNRGL